MSDETTPVGALAQVVNKIPWWAQIALLVGMTFGVPTIMLGIDKAQDIGLLDNPVAKSYDELTAAQQAGTKAMEELKGVVVQQGETNKQIIKALEEQNRHKQLRCVNKAKSDDERAKCLAVKKDED
jgi:hypothetical protein